MADEPVVVIKARSVTNILLLQYLHFRDPWRSKPVMVRRTKLGPTISNTFDGISFSQKLKLIAKGEA